MTTELVAVQGHIEEAGAIVWWRLEGEINHAELTADWTANGFDPQLLPRVSSTASCLRRVVNSHQEARYRVRPTKVGYAFFSEALRDENGDDLVFKTDLKVRAEENGTIVFDPPSHRLAPVIAAEVELARESLSAQECGSWLVDIAYSLEAVPLRDSGGVYFIPRKNLERWHAISSLIRKISAHRLSEVRALKSDEAVAAITEAVTRDAEAMFLRVTKEIKEAQENNIEIGERAKETRQQKLRALGEKLATYEALLGARLDVMRQRLEEVSGALALGRLL